MTLPALPIDDVLAMNAKRRHEYFEQFARSVSDAPKERYAIRVGATTLFADDTMDLRQKLERHVKNYRKWKARGNQRR